MSLYLIAFGFGVLIKYQSKPETERPLYQVENRGEGVREAMRIHHARGAIIWAIGDAGEVSMRTVSPG